MFIPLIAVTFDGIDISGKECLSQNSRFLAINKTIETNKEKSRKPCYLKIVFSRRNEPAASGTVGKSGEFGKLLVGKC